MDRTLSDATTPGQNGPGSDGNEGVLRIPQIPSITWNNLIVFKQLQLNKIISVC